MSVEHRAYDNGGQDHMTAAQRAAYEAEPMAQYDNEWKALGSEDVAEALHKIHDSWARSPMTSDWRRCHQCCTYANRARQVIENRTTTVTAPTPAPPVRPVDGGNP